MYTRDIVEAWLFAVRVNDTSFREANRGVNNTRHSAAAGLVADISVQSSLRSHNVTRIGRRAANDTFNTFLHCINGTFHDEGHTKQLDKLLSCDHCEVEDTQEDASLHISNGQ